MNYESEFFLELVRTCGIPLDKIRASFVNEGDNMKCAKCGKEIKSTDYISAGVSNQKDIYVHSMPCDWYDNEGNIANYAGRSID